MGNDNNCVCLWGQVCVLSYYLVLRVYHCASYAFVVESGVLIVHKVNLGCCWNVWIYEDVGGGVYNEQMM